MFSLGCGVICPEALLEEARGRCSLQREEATARRANPAAGQILPQVWLLGSPVLCPGRPPGICVAGPEPSTFLGSAGGAGELFCLGSFAGGRYLGLHFLRSTKPPQQFHFSSSLRFHTRLSFHPPSSVLPLSHFTLLSLNNVCIFY